MTDQAKLVKQRTEIARLTQKMEGLVNDLADIKGERDSLKDFVREVAKAGDDPDHCMDGMVRRLSQRARILLTPFKHRG